MEPINYDIGEFLRKQFEFILEGKTYLAKEAHGEAAAQYQAAMLRSAKVENGRVNINPESSRNDLLLVELCIWEVSPKGELIKVKKETIANWPNRVVKDLFERIETMSNLKAKPLTAEEKKQADEILKNASGLSLGGST